MSPKAKTSSKATSAKKASPKTTSKTSAVPPAKTCPPPPFREAPHLSLPGLISPAGVPLPPSPPTRSGFTNNSEPPLRAPKPTPASLEPGLVFDFHDTINFPDLVADPLPTTERRLAAASRPVAATAARLCVAPPSPLATSPAELASPAVVVGAPVTLLSEPPSKKTRRVAAALSAVATGSPVTPVSDPPSKKTRREAPPPAVPATSTSSSSSGSATSSPLDLLKLLTDAAHLNHLNLNDVLRAAGFVPSTSFPPTTASTKASRS